MDLLVDDRYRVRHLTLNRENKRNALSSTMCADLVEAVRSAETRPDIGCTLICANGSAFCAGMDLDEAAPVGEVLKIHEQLFTIGANAVKPIVIAVNGAALAGGLGLVAQGHVVLASPNAVFGLPEVRIGFWPLVVYRSVEAAVGKRRTLQLSLTGNTFDAEEALEWGLIHRISPGDELQDVATRVAWEIAKASPLAIGVGMEYAREASGRSAREAGEIAAGLRAQLMESGDFKEGTAAFKEKREAHWPSMPPEFYANRQGTDS